MLFSVEELKDMRSGMANEYLGICTEIMLTKEKIDPNSWTYKELTRAVEDFIGMYSDLDVMATLIIIIHEMDTEHDIFVVQKELNYFKEKFAGKEEFTMKVWESPRNVFGEKEQCQRRIEKQLIEFVEKAKRVWFEDVMGE